MSSLGAALKQWTDALEGNQKNAYSYTAALTFSVYDIILTSGEEIKYIWGSKQSPITTLYFIIRYYTVASLIAIVAVYTSDGLSIEACQRYFDWAVGATPSILAIILDVILLMRIFALYERSRLVFIVLLVLSLGDFAISIFSEIKFAKGISKLVILVPAWKGCVAMAPVKKSMLLAYLSNFALSLVYLAMTLWKLVENHRHLYGKTSWENIRNMDHVSPVLLAFVRDGSVYFVLTSVNTCLQIITAFAVHGVQQATLFPWILALYGFVGAHLILDLRAKGIKGTSPWNETLSFQLRPYRDEIPHGQLESLKFT